MYKMKKPAYKIAKEYFPNATDEFLEYVIWEKTGYPHFWNIPEDGASPEECFRKQLLKVEEDIKNVDSVS